MSPSTRTQSGLRGRELVPELDDGLARLLDGGAGTDAEERVGLGEPQLLEEHLGHLEVVVLPRVHQPRPHARLLEREVQRGHLDDLGAGADDHRHGHAAEDAGPW